MSLYSSAVYPAVLAAMALLLVAGALAWASPRLARALPWAAWAARIASGVQVLVIVVLVTSGASRPDAVMLVGYLLAAVAVLAFLGISRLAAPPAPGQPRDPDRPVLSPRQAIQVDAVAAILVAVALAVVAWRLHAIVLAG